MTNEEARAILEEVMVMDDSMFQYNPAYLESLEKALEALKQPTDVILLTREAYADLCLRAAKAGDLERELAEKKAEPCEDCVRRATILAEMEERYKHGDAITLGYIRGLPSVAPRPRWFPVSERLPEEDGEYLLWGKVIEDEENYIFIGDYDSCAEAFGCWKNYYDPITLGFLDGELLEYASVIAWMPLPKPYKEGESE